MKTESKDKGGIRERQKVGEKHGGRVLGDGRQEDGRRKGERKEEREGGREG